ncbi:MAG: hypothetical protein KDK08_29825 [Rhizobiaceae bacterium]|nr:hypothetical protein [Rhizobiaceae bacterium]
MTDHSVGQTIEFNIVDAFGVVRFKGTGIVEQVEAEASPRMVGTRVRVLEWIGVQPALTPVGELIWLFPDEVLEVVSDAAEQPKAES